MQYVRLHMRPMPVKSTCLKHDAKVDFLGCPRKRADLASQIAEFFCGVLLI